MAFAGQRQVGLTLRIMCAPDEYQIKNLRIFLKGLNGAKPRGGVGAGSTSTNPALQGGVIPLGPNGLLTTIPDPEIDTVIYQGCPIETVKTCPLSHNSFPSDGINTGIFAILPNGETYYETTYDYCTESVPGSGDFDVVVSCTDRFQLNWVEVADVNGCVPVAEVWFDPEADA